MIIKAIGCRFGSAIYTFTEVKINSDVAYVYLEGESFDFGVTNSNNTKIQDHQGDNLFFFTNTSSTRVKLHKISFLSTVVGDGYCFKKELPIDKNFSLEASFVEFLQFNYGFYSGSYTTDCILQDVSFHDCNVGFWSERESNFSTFNRITLFSNAIGIRVYGYQTYINQCQVWISTKRKSPLPNNHCYGIWGLYNLQIKNVYHEQYNYDHKELNPELHYYMRLDFPLNESQMFFSIENTSFILEDYVTHLLITGGAEANKIKIDGFKKHYIPKRIKKADDSLLDGIIINNKNYYANEWYTVFNKREFRIMNINQAVNHGYGDNLMSFIIEKNFIEGFDKIINNNSSVAWNQIYTDIEKTVILSKYDPQDFEIEYDFNFSCANITTLYKLTIRYDDGTLNTFDAKYAVNTGSENRVYFKGKYRGEASQLIANGKLIFGFLDDIPIMTSFKGFIHIRNL